MSETTSDQITTGGTGGQPPIAAPTADAPAAAQPVGKTTIQAGRPPSFNFVRHERVQKLKQRGLWAWLGQKFGDLEVRLIPFYEQRVVVRREAAEQAVRMQLTLGDDDPIPGEFGIGINKEAIHEALVGVRGRLDATPEVLRLARVHGLAIEGDQVVFTGSEPEAAVKEVFWPVVDVSMPMTTTLVRASRELFKVDDEVIDRLGESFVYGRHVKAALGD
jgi:hypothetical protein